MQKICWVEERVCEDRNRKEKIVKAGTQREGMVRETHTERWNTRAFRVDVKPSETELPETNEGHLSENLVMENMEPELAIFCKQARLPVVHV